MDFFRNYKHFASIGASEISLEEIAADQIKRIIVHAPSWVGDAVMSLPALHALRQIFPTAHVTVASRPGTSDIFIESDLVDDVLIQDRSRLFSTVGQAGEWRRRQFDLAV